MNCTFGQLEMVGFKQLYKENLFHGLDFKNLKQSTTLYQLFSKKQHKQVPKVRRHKSEKPIGVNRFKLRGPMETMIIDKAKYCLIFIVDYNKMIVV